MVLKSAAYGTALMLSAQSGRFQNTAQFHLERMAASSANAISLETAAASDAALAAEEESTATADAASAEVWTAKAEEALLAAGKEDALAAEDTEEAEALDAKSDIEASEAETAAANAAADEVEAEADEAAATAALAEVAETEAEEEADAAIVAACELIPFIDIACDVVGGVAGVALQATAAAEAAEAATATAAALAVRADEEAAAAEAASLAAESLADANAAAALETSAAAKEAEANALRAEAEADEAEADALEAEAEAQEAEATEETAKAEAEEAEAGESAADALRHGVNAFWNAILSAGFASVSMLFFAFQVLMRAIIPGSSILWQYALAPAVVYVFPTFTTSARAKQAPEGPAFAPRDSPSARASPSGVFCKTLRRGVLHVLAFISSAATFSERWPLMKHSNRIYRGESILIFALLAASADCMASHAIPHLHATRRNSTILRALGSSVLAFFGRFLLLFPLFVIEALIVWVNLTLTFSNGRCFSLETPQIWWMAFVIFAIIHWQLGTGYTADSEERETDLQPKTKGMLDRELQVFNSEVLLDEENPLLTKKKGTDLKKKSQSRNSSVCGRICHHVRSTHKSMLFLQLPIELLVLSCTIAFISTCSPLAIRLFHSFSKHIIPENFPLWPVVGGIAIGFIFIMGFIAATLSVGQLGDALMDQVSAAPTVTTEDSTTVTTTPSLSNNVFQLD